MRSAHVGVSVRHAPCPWVKEQKVGSHTVFVCDTTFKKGVWERPLIHIFCKTQSILPHVKEVYWVFALWCRLVELGSNFRSLNTFITQRWHTYFTMRDSVKLHYYADMKCACVRFTRLRKKGIARLYYTYKENIHLKKNFLQLTLVACLFQEVNNTVLKGFLAGRLWDTSLIKGNAYFICIVIIFTYCNSQNPEHWIPEA